MVYMDLRVGRGQVLFLGLRRGKCKFYTSQSFVPSYRSRVRELTGSGVSSYHVGNLYNRSPGNSNRKDQRVRRACEMPPRRVHWSAWRRQMHRGGRSAMLDAAPRFVTGRDGPSRTDGEDHEASGPCGAARDRGCLSRSRASTRGHRYRYSTPGPDRLDRPMTISLARQEERAR